MSGKKKNIIRLTKTEKVLAYSWFGGYNFPERLKLSHNEVRFEHINFFFCWSDNSLFYFNICGIKQFVISF